MKYNANDIERYLNKKMNAAEMHSFEQAMMDDPLLADAVDGFQSSFGKINAADDLAELKNRIKDRNQLKTIVIKPVFRKWMSIAAGFVILVSASVLLYNNFNRSEEKSGAPDVATIESSKTDTTIQLSTKVDSQTVAVNDKAVPDIKPKTVPSLIKTETSKESKAPVTKDNTIVATEQKAMTDEILSGRNAAAAPTSNAKMKEQEDVANAEIKKQAADIQKNKFSGIVVDEKNQPLPFTNIKEKKKGDETYADANGNFSLVSSDSVLTVVAKQSGYPNVTVQLKNNQQQKIVLQNQITLSEIQAIEKREERKKSRPSVAKTEAFNLNSEPVDGWQKFAIYIANNNRLVTGKETNQSTEAKNVVLSFDVNTDGTISNLKIEQSNCSNCNSEAIRLLKEGPQWKSNTGKTERSHYTVHF